MDYFYLNKRNIGGEAENERKKIISKFKAV